MNWLNPFSWGRASRKQAATQSNIRAEMQAHARAAMARVMARYDAAQTTNDNSRHWSMADGMSANAANSVTVRKLLRDRARYEIGNNCYAKGIVQTVANNTVGKGPRLQIRTGDKQADKAISRLFARWSREVRLPAKLRVMVKGRVGDGESFASIITNERLNSQIKLDFRPFEPEICTSTTLYPVTPSQIDGIEFDAADNPVSYWLLDQHPGDVVFVGSTQTPRQHDAANIIHLFKAERAGQKRGVPEITPALPLFAQLRRYTLAVIAAAEIAALISVFLKTTGSAITPAELTPWAEFDMARNAGMVMPDGWDMQQFKPEQPVTTYAEFKHEILNEISRCLDMPFNIAACNSSGYNYSSGKLDHKTYGVSTEIDRSELEVAVLDRLLFAWLDEAALIPGVIPDGLLPISQWSHTWFWDETPSADPLKDANAQDTKLRNGSAFLSDEWETQGRDFEEEIEQEAARFGVDVAEMKQIILTSLYAPKSGQPVDQPADGEAAPTDQRKGAGRAKATSA